MRHQCDSPGMREWSVLSLTVQWQGLLTNTPGTGVITASWLELERTNTKLLLGRRLAKHTTTTGTRSLNLPSNTRHNMEGLVGY